MKKTFKKLSLVLLICALMMTVAGCINVEETTHTHQYSETVTKAAACDEAGVKTFACSCGDSYTEEIEKLPHTDEVLSAVAPTCTETGLTEGKKCSVCGTVLVLQESVPATGHKYDDNYDATCNNKDCDFVRDADCRHANTEILPAVDATCTTTGLTEGVQCKDCTEIIVKQETAPMLNHAHSTEWSNDGSQHWHACSCGDKTDVADHDYTTEVEGSRVDATCEADGSYVMACVCGATKTEVIPSEGHNYATEWSNDGSQHWHECACGDKIDVADHDYATEVEGSRVDATCEADGSYVMACVCGETKTEVIPSEGHSYAAEWSKDESQHWHKCACDDKTDVADHDYTTEVEGSRVDATCEADGSYTMACVCGATKTEVIPSEGHSYESEKTEPTCTEQGYTAHTCLNCGDSYVDSYVEAGHSYESNVTEPTCTEQGYTTHTCSACGDSYVDSYVDAGHSYEAEVTEPTCNVGGYTTYTCSACGDSYTADETSAVGHAYDDDHDVDCNVCGEKRVVLFNDEVVKEYDVYALENKESLVVDFSENINNAGELALTYSVQYGGLMIDGATYAFALVGEYTDEVVYEIFTVTVSYEVDGVAKSISYTYTLKMKDTTAYRLANGDFENGMEGWTQVGNIGNVSSDTHYWVNDPESADGFAFGMDGEKMFSAYAPGALESAVGTLTSSTFKIGGSGFVTFKVGAMRDANYVYIDVVDAETKQILARYYNGLWAERTNDMKSGCTLIAYKADLSAFKGKEVFFRISDNADSGYGLFFLDSIVTYYENEPEGFNVATHVDYALPETIYDVFNGGFEMGGNQGWWNNGEPGAVTNADAFFSGVAYGKDGNFLYSGVEDHMAGNGREYRRGVLTSSVFEISGTGYITFMLGGGGNELCYVQIIDAVTGEILARYHQQAMEDAVLKQYIADLSAYIGRTVRIQVVDQAENAWGCVSFDNVVTYYPEGKVLPEGILAIDIKGDLKYTIDNGSFETGNIDGWTMNITESGAHNTLGWVLENEIDAGWYTKNDGIKDGRFLFTFAQPGDINCENTKGTLQSSTFSLKQGSFVSFKFGAAGGGINHDVYIELCRADGSVIARFYNDAEGKSNTRMNAYYYQYNDVEVNCFFRVVDNSTGNYGCLVIDDFRVNLESAPEGYIAAIQ